MDGRPTYVYVLTDFEPSGVSIAEKVESELTARAPSSEVHVKRLTVDREQIEGWSLPTRPTKSTDTRARRFQKIHGTESVELDASSSFRWWRGKSAIGLGRCSVVRRERFSEV